MRLVQAAGAPEFQVLFLPTRSGYELLQLLARLSGLEVPELHHDVSGKQDSSDTFEVVRPQCCRRASSERGSSAIPRWLGAWVFRQISDQKVVVPFRLWSSTLRFASPRGQLLKAESSKRTAWKQKKELEPSTLLASLSITERCKQSAGPELDVSLRATS